MSDIKAIETLYKGYRFRSRLEARWAVFLDALGAAWEYEKQGYVIDGTPYLPDFWVPVWRPDCDDAGYWIEIKPVEATQEENDLFAGLVEMTGHRGYLIAGNPWPGEHTVAAFQHHRDGIPKDIPMAIGSLFLEGSQPTPPVLWDYGDGKEDLSWAFDWRHRLMIRDNYWVRRDFPFIRIGKPICSGGSFLPERGALTKAFRAARSARFEHGEKPRV